MLNLDPNSAFGARALRRLEAEEVAWLTTVGAGGTPRPTPVWFLWDQGTILIYSIPNQVKLKNLDRQPRASFHLNSVTAANGDDVVVMTGAARIVPDAPAIIDQPAYVTKYAERMAEIGLTPHSMSESYATAIIFTPERVTGH